MNPLRYKGPPIKPELGMQVLVSETGEWVRSEVVGLELCEHLSTKRYYSNGETVAAMVDGVCMCCNDMCPTSGFKVTTRNVISKELIELKCYGYEQGSSIKPLVLEQLSLPFEEELCQET